MTFCDIKEKVWTQGECQSVLFLNKLWWVDTKKSHAKLCTLVRNDHMTIMKVLAWEHIKKVTGDLHSEQQLVGTPSCFRQYGAISRNSLQVTLGKRRRSFFIQTSLKYHSAYILLQ